MCPWRVRMPSQSLLRLLLAHRYATFLCSWDDSLVGQLITLLIDTTAVSDDGVSEQNHQEYNWERPKRMEWIDARKTYDA